MNKETYTLSRISGQVKSGYKKTSVGIIPKDWEVKKCGDVFEQLKTYTFSRDELGYEKKEGCLYNIHYGDIHSKFPTSILNVEKNLNLIPNIIIPKIEDPVLLKDGDLIMADASEDYKGVGQSIELINVGDKKIVSGTHTFALRPKYKFAPRYAGYIFVSYQTHKELKKVATGISVLGLSKTNISQIKFPIPPLEEQKSIANCLSTWDSGIEKLTQLIQTKKRQKQGLMQQLLNGTVRLRSASGERFDEEWEEVRLGDFSKILRGGSPRPIKKYITEKDVDSLNWLKIGDVKEDSKYIFQTKEKIIKTGLNKTRLIKKGELILSNSMSFGRPYILKIDACIHDGWLAITELKNDIDKEFLLYLFSTAKVQSILIHLAAGSGVRNLNKELVSDLYLKIPIIEEQQAIVKILCSTDKEIELLEQKLSSFQQQKKGLMQVLLTGEKRLIE